MSAEALQEDEIPVQRRAAAKKATKLAAQQLDSSPIRSGGEIDPTTFGEPSRSKVVVKKTYGGKVRGKFSPLKQTPESSEPSSSRVVRKSKSVPQLNSPTPSRRRKPPPSSSIPTSPAKSYKGKRKAITPTPTLSDDSEIEMLLPLPTVPARPKNKSPAKPAPTTNGKNSIQKTTKRGRKRPLSPQPSGPQSPASDASSLTPLSSPEPDEISLLCGPPASRDFTRSLTSRTIQSTSDVEETWDLNTLGSYVWVSMDTSGELSESNDDTLWWPAKVVGSIPLTVTLFGNPPSLLGTDRQRKLPIHNPSPAIVLSLKTSRGSVRFHENNYTSRPTTDDRRVSPRKRQKTADMDVHSRWLDALSLLLRADAEDNDGLPSTLSRFGSGVIFSDVPEVSRDKVHDAIEIDDEEWQPLVYSGPMEIPGELVLAKEKKASSDYWPAKVMAYFPPDKLTSQPKFELHYFDGVVKRVSRDMFYTDSDTGFVECKLGEAAGNYGLDEEERDLNGDFTMTDNTEDTEETLRAPSPTSTLLAPSKSPFRLSIAEQFEFVKPVLVAVLQGKYDPVRARHEAFMGSGASRRNVCDTNHHKGDLRARDVEELDVIVRQWVRRRQKRQDLGFVPRDEPDDPDPQNTLTVVEEDPPADGHVAPILQQVVPVSENQSTEPQSDGVAPPSSSVSATIVQDGQTLSGSPEESHLKADATPDSSSNNNISSAGTPMPPAGSPKSKELTPVDNPSIQQHQEPTHNAKPHPPRKTFASLSQIDQITYCTNVLLPEATLQLLLWRSGLRQSRELLSPSEEEELHSLAEEKSKEIDWVHQIVYAKRGATGSMLPSLRSDQALKPTEAVAGTLRSGRNR